MSGGFISENDPNYNFKGWRLYFNSFTKRGRLNWVLATYGTVFGIIGLRKLFKKKPIAAEAANK